ncbi:MAG: PilZ domain-containing protein [Gammaproteobacteria bacterium]|nr:PilZ domain-containing protein [Gammaproteobacteria bacterium]MDJ0870817.1 PilZ domain-containing protein [Gammaproteobacteria bacterium]MDJ0891037.1 PilZ domain-containing protein [Gammaproteobacteria bacterium]
MAAEYQPEVSGAEPIGQGSDDAAERRRYFRVEDRIILQHRPLADDERGPLVEELRDHSQSRHLLASSFASTSQQMQGVLRKVQEREPDVALYLQALNEKIDLLARQLALETTELSKQPPRWVDISAAGLCFEAPDPIQIGQLVELKMLLAPSFDYVRAIGRVVRCAEADRGTLFRVAVDFDYLRDDDRELLVQHVLRKQTSVLREQRGDAPET